MAELLRVLDLGLVSAPRSQALFHGIASAMREGDAPVLTLVSPAQPYVCIGMHQDVTAEVDEAYCRDAGLPVLRRHVGGGAVYLDHNQLFFHFIYPVHKAPRRVTDLYAHFVAPVLATYQAFGIHARLRPINDIHVNDRKIGGTGAAQIGDATIFVGSFMLDFDVETMARCLKVPSEKFRDKLRGTLHDYITTMRRELGEIPPREALVARFLLDVVEHLRVEPRHDELRDDEIRAVDEWERQLQEPDWLYQPNRRRFAEGVKITGGVHLGEAMHKARGGLVRVRLLSQNQRIADVDISGDFTCIPASGVEALAHALRGLDLASADMTPRIAQHMTTLGLDLPGVDAADIASAIRGACAQED